LAYAWEKLADGRHSRRRGGRDAHHGADRGMRNGIELMEAELVLGADIDISTSVLCLVAVLGRREDLNDISLDRDRFSTRTPTSDAFAVVLLLVTIHADLVRTDDSVEAVLVTESLRDIWAELHTHASLAGPSARCSLRVGPQHLHHETGLTRLPLSMSVQLSNVVKSDVVVREEAAMEDKILITDKRGQR
jgi:hypothetical protein